MTVLEGEHPSALTNKIHSESSNRLHVVNFPENTLEGDAEECSQMVRGKGNRCQKAGREEVEKGCQAWGGKQRQPNSSD